MTHSALSRRSWGMSSGTFRISEMTWPEFSTRLHSFLLSAMELLAKNRAATSETQGFFIAALLPELCDRIRPIPIAVDGTLGHVTADGIIWLASLMLVENIPGSEESSPR